MAISTREHLIDVARQLFSRKGVEATTMGDIANASERGRRTVYTYFRNKKEVYAAVLQSESDTLVRRLEAIVNSEEPVEERLREFLSVRLVQRREQNSAAVSLRALFKPDFRRMSRRSACSTDCLPKVLTRGVSKHHAARCWKGLRLTACMPWTLRVPTRSRADLRCRPTLCLTLLYPTFADARNDGGQKE